MNELLAQLLALVTFFGFPGIQYILLKNYSKREGRPELWYLPAYGFRLVVRNIPGKRTLSEIRLRALLRHVVPAGHGSSVADVDLTDPIHDVVREPADPQLPARLSGGPGHADLRTCANPIDCFSDRVEEFGAETNTLLLRAPYRASRAFGTEAVRADPSRHRCRFGPMNRLTSRWLGCSST